MNKYLILAVIGLLAVIYTGWNQVKYANEKWEHAEANVKSYDALLSQSEKKNTALQLTVDQLGYFKDSVLQELDATRRELNVKDKNLKVLQSISSSFSKADTITLRDTLFREPALLVDTLLGDDWYSVRLGLKYPSTIAVTPEFKSVKHVVVSARKETVNPPKKFWLFRLFQKKHSVIQVDVVEKNPYVDGESSRYVEIMK